MSEEFRSTHQPSDQRQADATADAWSSAPLTAPSPAGAELDNLEEDLLVQTAELVEQVQKQLADLNRREQALNAQTGQLEQDRRAFRLEKQDHEQHVLSEEERLQQARQELESRRTEFDGERSAVIREQTAMAEQKSAVERERADLNQQRERLRQDVAAELDQQRAELQESLAKSEAERQEFAQTQHQLVGRETELRETIERERSQLAEQQAGLAEQLEAERQSIAEQLETERQKLSEQITTEALTDEIVTERTLLAQEREAL